MKKLQLEEQQLHYDDLYNLLASKVDNEGVPEWIGSIGSTSPWT